MPWNDNANPGPWGSPSNGDDKREPPKRPTGGGGGPRRPGGPDFNGGFDRIQQRLRDMMGGPGGTPRRGLIPIVLGGAFAVWAMSGFYIVQPSEQAIVLTFGAYSRSETPGLRYHLPSPIERVEKVAVTKLNNTLVGGSGPDADSPAESQMLTGDEQIIDIDFSVTWRVADASRYLFATRDPEVALKAVAESAMREVVGKTQLQPIISTGRGLVQQQTAELMQKTLDSWGAGISIVEVQIRSAGPPPEVVAAFREVNNAQQDADSAENEANTYRNRVINEAKGDAARITQSAAGYREQAVREATGEAARFNQIYTEYRRAPGVTRDRLYIETMQRILQNSNKVVVDSKGASAPIILPPDVFRPKVTAPQPPVQAAPAQPQAKAGQ
ncbi:MAG: FtsH protease activity modulator HflK [Alphaproteobacteria bacterium]|nr:FtsH protease activity modulator HflK [Alphaproteobacteria bacterium]MBU1515507.1 FtsH protease activity modulator HflK [Alphaproteobacteria bacterium]MBU2095505.1 FtsH protease activity modulator HflK [Alphaproteobacteria bacterium]MBU2150746.1 FtsH protease activity modulator HflK [Alphaproteobacteria bacterium]MBU2307011.1 FtsH protease activity modulator HflK [Alphaproteobacteria bacterium]